MTMSLFSFESGVPFSIPRSDPGSSGCFRNYSRRGLLAGPMRRSSSGSRRLKPPLGKRRPRYRAGCVFLRPVSNEPILPEMRGLGRHFHWHCSMWGKDQSSSRRHLPEFGRYGMFPIHQINDNRIFEKCRYFYGHGFRLMSIVETSVWTAGLDAALLM